MATVYLALGSEVSIVEMSTQLMPGADPDLVKPLAKRLKKQSTGIYLNTRVCAVEADTRELTVKFEGDKAPDRAAYDAVLVAVGRSPNGHRIAAEAAGVSVDDKGFISVDKQQQTNQGHIFAIGDIVGQAVALGSSSLASELDPLLNCQQERLRRVGRVAERTPRRGQGARCGTRRREQGEQRRRHAYL